MPALAPALALLLRAAAAAAQNSSSSPAPSVPSSLRRRPPPARERPHQRDDVPRDDDVDRIVLPRRHDQEGEQQRERPKQLLDRLEVAEGGVSQAPYQGERRVRAEDQVAAALRGLLPEIDDEVTVPVPRHRQRRRGAARAAVVVGPREGGREEAEGPQELAGAEGRQDSAVEDAGVEPGRGEGREPAAEEGGEDRSGSGGRGGRRRS